MERNIKQDWPQDHYPTMEPDSPIAKEFNKRSQEHWTNTGRDKSPERLLWEILMDDYDERHKS